MKQALVVIMLVLLVAPLVLAVFVLRRLPRGEAARQAPVEDDED